MFVYVFVQYDAIAVPVFSLLLCFVCLPPVVPLLLLHPWKWDTHTSTMTGENEKETDILIDRLVHSFTVFTAFASLCLFSCSSPHPDHQECVHSEFTGIR